MESNQELKAGVVKVTLAVMFDNMSNIVKENDI